MPFPALWYNFQIIFLKLINYLNECDHFLSSPVFTKLNDVVALVSCYNFFDNHRYINQVRKYNSYSIAF